MKKNLLLLGACSLLTFGNLQAQQLNEVAAKKLAPSLAKAIEKGSFKTLNHVQTLTDNDYSLRSITGPQKMEVIVTATDAQKVCEALEQQGIKTTYITQTTLVAEATPEQLVTIANNKDVVYVPAPRKFNLLLDKTRKVTGVDKVQAGTDLETPFDGTGVIVGVIDQGFQFRHCAFLDENGNPRAMRVWDHESNLARPTAKVPEGADGFMDSEGHATHVTGIAAGTKVNQYYGMAPKADLYLVASTFSTPKILQEVKAIHEYAKNVDKPCVINMSFGAQVGPHDGSTDYDRTISNIITEASQGDNTRLFVCAANGNEGQDLIHASYNFDRRRTIKLLTHTTSFKNSVYGCIYSNATDSTAHLTFRPYITSDRINRTYLTPQQLENYIYYQEGIDPNNKKQYVNFSASKRALNSLMNNASGPEVDYQFGIEVIGDTGDGFHAWLEPQLGEWVQTFPNYTIDSKYLVGEGAATITQAFSVGAFGVSRMLNTVRSGSIARFSSPGPWLGEGNKPEICAPGVAIVSSYNQYTNGFEPGATTTSIEKFGKTYYYGSMSGTSMATPVVTGIVALWLQANPKLTRDQILDIFKESSIHDNFTGTNWSPFYGYGKIDAYNGIKKALELKTTGINEINNSNLPLTISKSAREWRVLFNNDESFADIQMTTLTGQNVSARRVEHPRQGQEEVISFAGLTPGVYIIRINTTKANYTRKIMVGQ